MSGSRKKSLFVAAAGMAIWAFMQSPSAQISGSIGGDLAPKSTETGSPMEMRTPPTAAEAVANRKAEDAMTIVPNSPLTDADRRASAAMSK